MSLSERSESRLQKYAASLRRAFTRWKDTESKNWERAKAFALQLGHDALTAEQYADEWAMRGSAL